MRSLTSEQANAVYTILVEECGAPADERSAFVGYMRLAGVTKVWHFDGHLAHGECRMVGDHPIPLIAIYDGSETETCAEAVNRANQRIADLFAIPSESAPVVEIPEEEVRNA